MASSTHLQEFVFVGLGNPGRAYEKTRHNIGYLVVQSFANKLGWPFKEEKRFNAYVTKGLVESKTVHLILPKTYMNQSGVAVKPYLDFFKLKVSSLVAVVDDIALSFGEMKLKAMGTAGGHNGLKSLQECLATTHYTRLRMGIGHPGEEVLSDYVLDPFSKEELEQLEPFVNRGIEVLERLLIENISQVMNVVNKSSDKKSGRTDLTNPLL